MTNKQQAMLDSIELKVHDPDGVTVQMIMDRTGYTNSWAHDLMSRKIASGEAVLCWVKRGNKWVKGMKLK